MKKVAYSMISTLVVFLIPWISLAQTLTADVKENTPHTVLAENVLFLGHSTSFWDGNLQTYKATRHLIRLGKKYDLYTVATAAKHMIEDEEQAKKHYFSRQEANLVVESRGGQHELLFPNLKNVFFVGGNLNRCLCEGMRDVARGFSDSKNFQEVNMYLIPDGIYANYNIYSPVTEEKVAHDFVQNFFVPAFRCPLQNWQIKKRKKMPGVAMSFFFMGRHIKDFDLEPNDNIPMDQLRKKINVHFVNSHDIEKFIAPPFGQRLVK